MKIILMNHHYIFFFTVRLLDGKTYSQNVLEIK